MNVDRWYRQEKCDGMFGGGGGGGVLGLFYVEHAPATKYDQHF